MSSNERWIKDTIIVRIQKWNKRYGQPPRLADWRHSGADEDGAFPSEATVKGKFGSWNAAINHAGFAARSVGRPGNYTVEGGPYVTSSSSSNSAAPTSWAALSQPACFCLGAQKKLDAIRALIETDQSVKLDTIKTIIDA